MKHCSPIIINRTTSSAAIWLVLQLWFTCITLAQPTACNIMYNQVGYNTFGAKMVLTAQKVTAFELRDSSQNIVAKGEPSDPQYWPLSGEWVRKIDFSTVRKAGHYTLQTTGSDDKPLITIADRPYTNLLQAALKAFYYNRSAITISPEYGGKWARKGGHPDTVVYIHPTAAGPKKAAFSVISSPGGWYDAGDYNKYMVNSSITVFTLMKAFELFPERWINIKSNIPESNDTIPDILQEAFFNLRWMTTMQDADDGGVYHKLTNKDFDDILMPGDATNQRFVVQKTTAATLDFAAVAAHASMLIKNTRFDLKSDPQKLLIQAEKAWQWAQAHHDKIYIEPTDIKTGQYDDDQLADEFFWAATELFLATSKPEYFNAMVTNYHKPVTPEWANVNGLGFISLVTQIARLPEGNIKQRVIADFTALADSLTLLSEKAPYAISLQDFAWGSNSFAANQGMVKLIAYCIKANKAYLNSAQADLDYLLGRNPTGYCFVTSFGNQRVMNIHHRPSQADTIAEPVPGFLVGGPNTVVMNDCPDTTRSTFPAVSYIDLDCSYSTNEVAINWNAPLLFLAMGCNEYE